jgi:hypothetical protein
MPVAHTFTEELEAVNLPHGAASAPTHSSLIHSHLNSQATVKHPSAPFVHSFISSRSQLICRDGSRKMKRKFASAL